MSVLSKAGTQLLNSFYLLNDNLTAFRILFEQKERFTRPVPLSAMKGISIYMHLTNYHGYDECFDFSCSKDDHEWNAILTDACDYLEIPYVTYAMGGMRGNSEGELLLTEEIWEKYGGDNLRIGQIVDHERKPMLVIGRWLAENRSWPDHSGCLYFASLEDVDPSQ